MNLLQHWSQLAIVVVCLSRPDRIVDNTTYQDDRAGETSVRLGNDIPCTECSVWDHKYTRARNKDTTVSLPVDECRLPADAGVAINVDLVDLVVVGVTHDHSNDFSRLPTMTMKECWI